MINRYNRPANLIIAGYGYLKSSVSGRPFVYGMPPAVGIELTNLCNLRCPECASGSGEMKRERGFMDPGLYRKIISELSPYLYNINLYFQGEPLLHPGFYSFIRQSGRIRTVISTNGHYLSVENSEKIARSGLGKLVISLDGLDQASYSAYRAGGNAATVLTGIGNISDAVRRYGSSLKLEIQVLVNKFNEHQIPRLKKLAALHRASLKLKSMQITGLDGFDKWLPADEKFRRYAEVGGEYRIKNTLPARCARLWFNPVITWDGKVLPCCFDKDAQHAMGDLALESFRDIWNGTKYSLFRRILMTNREATDICSTCTSGMKGVNC